MKVKIYIGTKTEVLEDTLIEGKRLILSANLNDLAEFSFSIYPNFPNTESKNKYGIDFAQITKLPTDRTEATEFIGEKLSENLELDVEYDLSDLSFTIFAKNGSPILDFTDSNESSQPQSKGNVSGKTPRFITILNNIFKTQGIVKIVNDFALLDLFDEEKIELKNNLGDIEKLSNVFSDYTNSFTVPANENNNKIFKHYYDIDIDNGFDASTVVEAMLEVSSFPIRRGTMQLEGVKTVMQMPNSYKITFYSNVIQLLDLFGDDTINRLDYNKAGQKVFSSLSFMDFEYTLPNLLSTFNNPVFKSNNIITPLIAYTDRDWQYNGTEASKDISSSTGAILDTELRQAIKIARIMEAIEIKYGINFSNDFILKSNFQSIFMWMNARTDNVIGDESLTILSGNVNAAVDGNTISMLNSLINIVRDKFRANAFVSNIVKLEYAVTVSDATINYTVILKDANGLVLKKFENNLGNKTFKINFEAAVAPNQVTLNNNIQTTNTVQMFIQSNRTMSYGVNVNCRYIKSQTLTNLTYINNPNTNTVFLKVEKNLPQMKVIDFVSGIMKMFKLVIRPQERLGDNFFYLDSLNNYYSKGNVIDITDYIKQDEVTIDRPKIYSKIEYLYEKTDNLLGKTFRKLNDPFNDLIGYGDLSSSFPQIKNKDVLSVKLPFENMLFERMVDLDNGDVKSISIGQSVSSDDLISFSENDSKPILFYSNGVIGSSLDFFFFKFGNQTVQVNHHPLIGNTNDELLTQVTQTLNWGTEIDPWHLQVSDKSLFKNFWSDWISSIYSKKQRKIGYKAALPARLVDTLELNDSLIIGSNRYRINDFTVDLTSGETDFTFFNDLYAWTNSSFNQPINNNTLLISTNELNINAGAHWYGVDLLYKLPWTVEKVQSGGYGLFWLNIVNESGEGEEECTFVLNPNTSGQFRTMDLLFTVGNQQRVVNITQNSLQ
jgi:hypothetical protein